MGVKGPSLAAPMVVTAARDAVAERIGACTTKPDAHASRTSMRRIRSAIPDLCSARKIRDGTRQVKTSLELPDVKTPIIDRMRSLCVAVGPMQKASAKASRVSSIY